MGKKAKAGALAVLIGLSVAAACDDTTSETTAPRAGDAGAGSGAAGGGTGTTPGATTTVYAVAPAEQAAVFAPSEIASVAFVVNQGEVDQAQLAVQKATSAEVRAFAERMLSEHTQAALRLSAITPNAGATAASDPTSSVMARQDRLVGTDLATLSGAEFDVAYVTAQVDAHAKVVALLERALLPSLVAASTNTGSGAGTGLGSGTTPSISTADAQIVPPLTTELTAMRTTVAQHLVDALRLQQALRATLLGTSGVDAGGGVDAGTATDAGTGGRDAGAAEDAGEDAGEVEDAGEDAAGAP